MEFFALQHKTYNQVDFKLQNKTLKQLYHCITTILRWRIVDGNYIKDSSGTCCVELVYFSFNDFGGLYFPSKWSLLLLKMVLEVAKMPNSFITSVYFMKWQTAIDIFPQKPQFPCNIWIYLLHVMITASSPL